jgi:hypothetical protein
MNASIGSNDVTRVVEAVVNCGTRKATYFISPKLVVKASAMHKQDRRNSRETVVLTIGKPNYEERAFVAKCKKNGTKLPLLRMTEWKK